MPSNKLTCLPSQVAIFTSATCLVLLFEIDVKKVRQFEEMTVTDIAAGGNHSLFAVEYPGNNHPFFILGSVSPLTCMGSYGMCWLVCAGFTITKGKWDEKVKTPARYREVWAAGFGRWGQLGDRWEEEGSIGWRTWNRLVCLIVDWLGVGHGHRACVHLSTPRSIKELRVITSPEESLPITRLSCGENHSAAIITQALGTKQQVGLHSFPSYMRCWWW